MYNTTISPPYYKGVKNKVDFIRLKKERKKKKMEKIYRYITENDLNEYEKENERLSYKNLFYDDDALILCNNIINDYDDMELMNGNDYDEENDEYSEIYQYYIINDDLANRLINYTDEIVYYNNKLDIYVLGVQHYGTSWGYVLTDFRLIEDEENGFYKAIKESDV